MALVRRSALSVLAWAACAATGPASSPPLILAQPAGPGSLSVRNPGAEAVTVERAIAVETRIDGAWRPVLTEFNAVATCLDKRALPVVSVPAGETLNIWPWRGYSCSGQCRNACRRNVYAGPGPFHFVVTVAPSRVRVVGPPFTMPTRPPGVAGGRTAGASFRLQKTQPR